MFDSHSSYLQKMSEDMANSALVRRKCTDLHQRFTDTKFILYMLFLIPYLFWLLQIRAVRNEEN